MSLENYIPTGRTVTDITIIRIVIRLYFIYFSLILFASWYVVCLTLDTAGVYVTMIVYINAMFHITYLCFIINIFAYRAQAQSSLSLLNIYFYHNEIDDIQIKKAG